MYEQFLQKIKKVYQNYRQKQFFNLTPVQRKQFKFLQENKNFISIKADKNLDILLLNTITYKKRAVSDHLSHADTYRRLSVSDAAFEIKENKKLLRARFTIYKKFSLAKSFVFYVKN